MKTNSNSMVLFLSVIALVGSSAVGCGGGQLKLTRPIDVKNLVVVPSVHEVTSDVEIENHCVDRAGQAYDGLAKWFANKVAEDLQGRGTGRWTVTSADLPDGVGPEVFESTTLWGPPMLASTMVTFFPVDGEIGEPCTGMLFDRNPGTNDGYGGEPFPDDWNPDADAVLLISVNTFSYHLQTLENNRTFGPDVIQTAKLMTLVQYALLDRKDGAVLATRNVKINGRAAPSGDLGKQFTDHVPRITDTVANTFLGEEK